MGGQPSPGSSKHEAGTNSGQNALPTNAGRTHTHIHTQSYWDNSDKPIKLSCTSLGCGRKLQYLEKTHVDMGKHANSTQTVAPAWDFIIIVSHQCYNEMLLNKMMLFKDLLCRKKQSIYRVWYYTWFQASIEGLGTYLWWIRGYYCAESIAPISQ